MIDSFWEKLGEGLAGQWNARSLTPAFAFWGGGLLVFASWYGWWAAIQWMKTLDTVTGAVLLVGGVFLLATSTALVEWMTLPVLRLVEGYWPSWLDGFKALLVRRLVQEQYNKERQELNKLSPLVDNDTANSQQFNRYASLDARLTSSYPYDARLRLPSYAGNLLRAAEEHPDHFYGLEISTTWPRLWLALPESVQTELTAARQALNQSVQLLVWGLAFLMWCIFAWWAVVPAVLVILPAWSRIATTAGVYGQLLCAAYDLHRFGLYEQVRWPLPGDPFDEKPWGEALTRYLRRQLPPKTLPPGVDQIRFQHRPPGG